MIIKPANAPRKSKGAFARLVRYMVSAKDTERCTWFMARGLPGVDRPEDIERGIRIVEAFQTQNHRSRASRTYHMVIAFDPRDRSLEKAELAAVVERALSAIGFEEHQFVAVRHSDQEHEHIHVAVNKVHPLTFRIHHPRHDIPKLMTVATELEIEFGLHIVENRKKSRHELQPRTRDYEAHTGVQSFERWAKQHVANAIELSELGFWSDLHEALATHGLRMVPRGNGLAVVDAERTEFATKASALGRQWSKSQLSKRFGEFVPGPSADRVIELRRARYEALPLRGGPDGLWQEYQGALEKARRDRAERSHETSGPQSKPKTDGYDLRHALVRALPVSGRDQLHLHHLIELERRARATGAKRVSPRHAEPERAPHPGSWLEFLSKRASEGDPRAARRLQRDDGLPKLSGRGRWTETQLPYTCFRTSKGSRVHILASGQRLFETRKTIRFSRDADAETLGSALELAKHKFGRSVMLDADARLRQRLSRLGDGNGIEVECSSRQRGD